MKGRVCLITGANRGLGFETARALAKQGATVVILCRSKESGEKARQAIIDETKNQGVELLLCDLSLQKEVRRAVEEFKSRHDRLHVLVNNAGIFSQKREMTAEGIERVLATNYLSHFLLANLLLDTLKASAPARIVNVATKTMGISIDLDDLMLEKSYSFMSSMGRTKMGLILFTLELSKKLEGTGVTVNALHPGVAKTGLIDNVPAVLATIFRLIGQSPEKGASTAVYLATSPEVAAVSGKLFASSRPVAMGGQAKDPQVAEQLWRKSAELTGIGAPA